MADETRPSGAPDTPPAGETAAEPFDALAAAAELAESLAGSAAPAGDDPLASMLEEEVAELTALLDRKQRAIEDAEARAARAHEEIERVKERLARESEREVQRRGREVLLAVLEVVDELDRVLAASREPDHLAEVVAGVELVHRQLLARLERWSVRREAALHLPFDAARHEAVSMVPDAGADGRVVAVVREGYSLGDDLLRPARVVVGKRPT